MTIPNFGLPIISIVVGTFNRSDTLRRTLESLSRLETLGRFNYEIVVINNASTDSTQEAIADAKPGEALAVREFYEGQPGVAFARNRGIQEARGEWLAFHDDDQLADPRWLLELFELAKERNVLCVGGAVKLDLPKTNTRRLAPQCRRLLGEKVGMDVEQPYSRKRIPGTNNLMVHASVLCDVGIFDVSLKDGGEDADLFRRIRTAGYESWYTPESVVHHLIPEQRLSDDYMRWTATRHGQHVAIRELRDWGRIKLIGMTIVRLGQATANYLPRYVLARVGGDSERALGARCLLWRSEGYLRKAMRLVFGVGDPTQSDVSLNLREGREGLIHGVSQESFSRASDPLAAAKG